MKVKPCHDSEAWISRGLFVAWAMRLGRLDYGFTYAEVGGHLYKMFSTVQEENGHVQIPKCKFYSAISQCNITVLISQCKFHCVFSTVQEENEHLQISQCVQHSTLSLIHI